MPATKKIVCENCGILLIKRNIKRHQSSDVCQNMQTIKRNEALTKDNMRVIEEQSSEIIRLTAKVEEHNTYMDEIVQLRAKVEEQRAKIEKQTTDIQKLRRDARSSCPHCVDKGRCRICAPNSKFFCKLCHHVAASKKYKGYCMNCYVYTFPDDELSKNARCKSDELKVKVYLAEKIPGFIHNRRIWLGDCAVPYRRFLDFHIMIGNTLVVIEVDENQHKYYNKEDEKLRIHEVLNNIGLDKKMVFIRFNPSPYKCEGTNVDMDTRLDALGKQAQETIEYLESGAEYEDIHHEIKMFYDEI